MEQIKVKANAKINLNLDIIGLDERGYHLMEMIMQSVSLHDVITVQKNDTKDIVQTCDNKTIPCNSKNICYKCAAAFLQCANISDCGVDIDIQKNIPQQAGMAGGSADGAGVLVGLNKLFGTGFSEDELCDIGSKIGADIPFCIKGGTALVEGFGEKITKISSLAPCSIVIVKPRAGINTKRAFELYDKMDVKSKNNNSDLVSYIEQGDIVSMAKNMYNSLELVAGIQQIPQIKSVMASMGAKGSMMTGSGSAVFGIFLDKKRAFDCYKKLGQRFDEVFLSYPTELGVEIVE